MDSGLCGSWRSDKGDGVLVAPGTLQTPTQGLTDLFAQGSLEIPGLGALDQVAVGFED